MHLGQVLGIIVTDNLGRSLGVPIVHGRITKETYKYIVEKMSRRLEDWSSKMLSMAGRLVLNQTVLSAIPSFTMQTAVLTKATCSVIDKIQHDFLWGDFEAK